MVNKRHIDSDERLSDVRANPTWEANRQLLGCSYNSTAVCLQEKHLISALTWPHLHMYISFSFRFTCPLTQTHETAASSFAQHM